MLSIDFFEGLRGDEENDSPSQNSASFIELFNSAALRSCRACEFSKVFGPVDYQGGNFEGWAPSQNYSMQFERGDETYA